MNSQGAKATNKKDNHIMKKKQRSRDNHNRKKQPTSVDTGHADERDGQNVTSSYQGHKVPLIRLDEDNSTWYNYGKDIQGRNDTVTSHPPNRTDQNNNSLVLKYRALGDVIYQKEIQLVSRSGVLGKDERWVENTIRKGTLKDRIAAMSVAVSTDPVHKFYALDNLLAMVGCTASGGKTNSRVAQLAAEALDDLFISTFLPLNRKLMNLSQRPLYRYDEKNTGGKSTVTLSPRVLLLWRFEEMVKEKFDLYLRKYMAQTLQDGVEMHKIATLQSAANLLSAVPEGEAQILGMIVNKLGDPGKKIAAAAGHQLRLVLQQHPNMQVVIAREVQQLAHRPKLSPRALYNCIVFLNQLKLGVEEQRQTTFLGDDALSVSLIKTYFRLFDLAVNIEKNKDGQVEEADTKSRLLSALLTGVNRARPYLPEKDKDMEEHIDALYRVVHTSQPAATTQALMLLFHLTVGIKEEGEMEVQEIDDKGRDKGQAHGRDRFYRALYATLAKPSLVSHGKHLTMYFNLLYKAMKYDTEENRVHAFAKRLMGTVLHSSSPSIAGSLFLLNEIAKTHNSLHVCMSAIPSQSNIRLVLDGTKREPKAAINVCTGSVPAETDADSVRCPPSWDLGLLSHHFHPSVSKFANSIGTISYTGDPLKDFALAPFLDKFAYRNPKAKEKVVDSYKRGESIAKRRIGVDTQIQARLELPVNDPRFLEQEQVNEQDQFFHNYFTERARRDGLKLVSHEKEAPTNDTEPDEDETFETVGDNDWDPNKRFEDFEQDWEEDPDEEAYVDSLAVKLMEDSLDGEAADLDDEDPDMDDWGDLHDDEDNTENHDITHKHEVYQNGISTSQRLNKRQLKTNDFDDLTESIEFSGEHEDTFIDFPEESDSDDGSTGYGAVGVGSKRRSDSESEGEDGEGVVFANAEEYEKRIARSWHENKEGRIPLTQPKKGKGRSNRKRQRKD